MKIKIEGKKNSKKGIQKVDEKDKVGSRKSRKDTSKTTSSKTKTKSKKGSPLSRLATILGVTVSALIASGVTAYIASKLLTHFGKPGFGDMLKKLPERLGIMKKAEMNPKEKAKLEWKQKGQDLITSFE